VRAVDPTFALDDHRLGQAIELCRSLDGLPLAIELAAARVPLLGLRTVHDRLDERFRLLTAGARTALPRHQTLRAAMAWSHGLLTDAQRAVFRRLGVFSGGFTMALAQALCSDAALAPWEALEHVGALVDKSLVIVQPSDPPRYRLLESARAFALEQLAAAGEAAGMAATHARTMTAFLRVIDDANMDGELRTDAYAAQVLPELDNLRAAYAWARSTHGDPSLAIALAASATPLGDYTSEFREWLLEQWPLSAAMTLDPAIEARLSRGLAAFNMSGFVPTRQGLEAALRAAELYRSLGLTKREVSSLRLVASWRIELGDHAGAAAALDQADALIRPDWGAEFRMTLLRSRTRLASEAGQVDRAIETALAAIALARRCGDWRLEVIERTNHAEMVWQSGDFTHALALLAALREEVGEHAASDYELLDLLLLQSAVAGDCGRPVQALESARAALPAMRTARRFNLPALAHLLWHLGSDEAAARLVGAFDARQRAGLEIVRVNDARLLATARAGLAMRLAPDVLAAQQRVGAGLDGTGVLGLLAEALRDASA
jgi:hypothetical protein